MSDTKVWDCLSNIISRNKDKNLLFRKSFKPILESAVNVEDGAEQDFKPANQEEPVHLIFQNKYTPKYLKLVHSISSPNNDGKIEMYNESNLPSNLLFDIGHFSNSSISYYCRFKDSVRHMIITVTTKEEFNINQLEFIEISKLEYKFRKAQLYLKKIKNIVNKQPHLKQKFVHELKTRGLKATLSKVKAKMLNYDLNTNVIQYTGNELRDFNTNKDSILVISHDAQRAGAPLLAVNIVKTLKEIFHKDVYVILMKGGPSENEFSKYANVINLNQGSLSNLENEKEVRAILAALKEKGVNQCISNTVVSGALNKLLFEAGINTATLIHELPTSIKTYNFTQSAEYVSKYSNKIIFPNQFVRDEFLKEYTVNPDKIFIKPQGLYTKRDDKLNKVESKNKICEKLGIPSDSSIILGCGYADLRKGIDKFISTADEVVNVRGKDNIHFVWLGDSDSIVEQWMKHDISILNLKHNFHFVAYDPQPLDIFAAADVFLLTSREDPFPTVVLMALDNGTPVISFNKSGGVPELMDKVDVKSIPYLNASKMADEAIRIIENETERQVISSKGIELIEQEYDHNSYVARLIEILEGDNAQYEKRVKVLKEKTFKVSVIIPNYNYEKFLPERIESIISQTYRPTEIIFLDDRSKDNSVQVAREILEQSDIAFKVIVNDVNVGCFGQWIKGIEESSGDLIWIAEADDVCETNFLENMVGCFVDQEVNLAYAQSQIINEHSQKINYRYTEYTSDLSEDKWLHAYTLEGREEIVAGLGIKNTIPNASAVVMRKSALQGIEKELSQYQISGDWLTYVYILRNGKISFCPQILNYHRRHSQSIISVKEQSSELYLELIKVKRYIVQNFDIPLFIKNRFINHIKSEYERLGCRGFSDRNISTNERVAEEYSKLQELLEEKIEQTNYLQVKKKILLIAPDFEVGGGQMLVVRLANFFAATQDVYVYNARPWLWNKQILNMFSLNVRILNSSGNPEELRDYIIEEKIEVINSHIWWSDKIVYKAIQGLEKVNWILSMHGCYENMIENPDIDQEFSIIIKDLMHKANHIIYATSKNTKIFDVIKLKDRDKAQKVYYGYNLQSIPPKSKRLLNIPEGEFVFGLVSRAIKEKGWEESISAVIRLNNIMQECIHLILVGHGNYAQELREKYLEYPYIHFVSEFTEPSEWIGWLKIFDVAILPTYFVSESLPNSIIEYLAYNKPVIATDIGDIKHMIYSEKTHKSAGILLNLNEDRRVEVEDIVQAMKIMLTDETKYKEYKSHTNILFEQFQMENFAQTYFSLYLNFDKNSKELVTIENFEYQVSSPRLMQSDRRR